MGNTVDVVKATYTNTIGAVELKQVWTDPEFDPAPTGRLLRPRAGNPHPALEHLRRQQARGAAAERRLRRHPGARVDLTDLVHAPRSGARQRATRPDGRRPEAEGRNGARRGSIEASGRRARPSRSATPSPARSSTSSMAQTVGASITELEGKAPTAGKLSRCCTTA